MATKTHLTLIEIVVAALLVSCTHTANGSILEIGSNKKYQRVQQVALVAKPGDTLLLFGGIYNGGDFISRLHGSASAWITICAAEGNKVIYRGGAVALHISEASYLKIEGLIFEQQSGNGVNIDDGGTGTNSTHHIDFERCQWRNMNAMGNNDELKLSGVNDFSVAKCIFSKGATGGSLVDMVGCHRGLFQECLFENAGSNCIQAKGGSSDILITRNKFINGGERAVNIGGSTGLAFFRPKGANYEAKNVRVYANIFVGSTTPVAFVGAVECAVVNNTIYSPKRWALRILQETTATGFLACSNNTFSHNIIVFPHSIADAVNVGANTAPETFTISHNLWYRTTETQGQGGPISIPETNTITQQNPLFADTTTFRLTEQSPAIRAGNTESRQPKFDYYGNTYATPRSIGAVEFIRSGNVGNN